MKFKVLPCFRHHTVSNRRERSCKKVVAIQWNCQIYSMRRIATSRSYSIASSRCHAQILPLLRFAIRPGGKGLRAYYPRRLESRTRMVAAWCLPCTSISASILHTVILYYKYRESLSLPSNLSQSVILYTIYRHITLSLCTRSWSKRE